MRPSDQLLTRLLNQWQSNPDSGRRRTITINEVKAPEYLSVVCPDAKDELHAALINAENGGCIQLEWGKHYQKNNLKRIILVSGPKLASWLNIPLAKEIADVSRKDVMAAAKNGPDWVMTVARNILEGWGKGRAVHRLDPGDTAGAIRLLTALACVANGQHTGLDLRTFSARCLGDSKYMERQKSRFATIWNQQFNTGLDPDELFESLGLLKFAPPAFLKGPCLIKLGGSQIDLANAKTYIGLPPDLVSDITFVQPPDYVLTIENLASFNRHIREINDNGLVVFSSGFLSPGSSKILRLLDSLLPKINFYHWGDIDVGGLRIATHIQSQLGKRLNLHLMDAKILASHGKLSDSFTRGKLAGLQTSNEEIDALISLLLHTDNPLVLEQENIDPSAPIFRE